MLGVDQVFLFGSPRHHLNIEIRGGSDINIILWRVCTYLRLLALPFDCFGSSLCLLDLISIKEVVVSSLSRNYLVSDHAVGSSESVRAIRTILFSRRPQRGYAEAARSILLELYTSCPPRLNCYMFVVQNCTRSLAQSQESLGNRRRRRQRRRQRRLRRLPWPRRPRPRWRRRRGRSSRPKPRAYARPRLGKLAYRWSPLRPQVKCQVDSGPHCDSVVPNPP